MIAAPVYSSGLGLSSYAASENSAESETDIAVAKNTAESETDIAAAENGAEDNVAEENNTEENASEDSSKLKTSDNADGAEAALEGAANDGNLENGQDEADADTGNNSNESEKENTVIDDSTGNGDSVDAENTTSTNIDDSTGSANVNTSTNGGVSTGDSSNSDNSTDTQLSDIKEAFNSKTPLDNAGVDKTETEKFENTANPFGLADEDLPSEREDLGELLAAEYGEYDLISLAAEDASDSNKSSAPDIVVNEDDAYFTNSFTITYTTVNDQQKTFTITSDMGPDINLLYVRYVDSESGYYGFKVLSISIDVKDEKSGKTLTFYADDITGGNFRVVERMMLSNGDLLTGELQYCADTDAEDAKWSTYTDATLTSGRYSINVRKPYGTYRAKRAELEKPTAYGKALLIAIDGDDALGNVPIEDANAIKATLTRTQQFKEEDIEILSIPADTTDDYKSKIREWIANTAAASDNELTFISYSGHGNYENDGTSELSIGGSNTISAAEFKKYVSQLHGKAVMLLDCCFSGGMIMPTMLEADETEPDSIGASSAGVQETYQELQDKASKAFVNEFKNAKAAANTGDGASVNAASDSDTASAKTAYSDLEYYIYAGGSPDETTSQAGFMGGQLTALFGYALGYARAASTYNIYAADVDGNHEVSARELADYIKSSSIESKPTVYYPTNHADDALFSYDEDESTGVPAILSIKTISSANVTPDADGTVSVEVSVTNHSDAEVQFDAGAVLASNTGESSPGAIDPGAYSEEDSMEVFYKEGVNEGSIAAGETESFTFKFTDATNSYFINGGRYVIKIWETGNEDSMCFALTDFYTGKTETADAVDAAGKAAFAIKEPAQIYAAADGNEVSAIVPLKVVFDTEPTTKSGYAALTLTAKAYYLPTKDGSEYSVDDNGEIALNEKTIEEGTQEYSDIYVNGVTDIYTDIRPTYVRNDVYSMDGTGSCYTYAWDVSGLDEGYYAVQVTCEYDADDESHGKTYQKKTTFIRVIDKASADESTRLIGESTISMGNFAAQAYGIRVGDGWANYKGKVANVTKNLTMFLNYYSYNYDGKNKDITFTVADESAADGCASGWFRLNDDDSLTPMAEDDYFESGQSYVNRIILTIDSGYDAMFAYGCAFTVSGHELYNSPEADGKVQYKSGVTEGNQKQAILYVIHRKVDIPEDEIKVYHAGTKTPLTEADTLKVGDKIDVYVPSGYAVAANVEIGCLKKIAADGTGYDRYEVVQGEETEIRFTVFKLFDAVDRDDDCCATVLYAHAISDIKDTVTGISAPKKTFYDYTDNDSLDLTGSKVTYYAKNGDKVESKTADLGTFISNNDAKLYVKDGDKYYAWEDSYLEDFGFLDIYLLHNGVYTKAFNIEAGYTQGDNFSIDGSFTFNSKGEASYLEEDDLNNIVLSLKTDANVWNNCQGTVKVTYDLSIMSEYDNASDYSNVYYTDGATIRFLLPYPEGVKYSELLKFSVDDNDRNVPVTIKNTEEGIWVTAARDGEFTMSFDTGGKGGADNDSRRARNSSGRTANGGSGSGSNSKVYGSWKTETLRIGSAGASGVINVNGIYVVPSTGVIEPDGSSNAASAVGTETVTLYRFMMNNGEYATGWKQISYNGADKWFFFGNDGYMRVGWAHDNNTWYYLQSDGVMATGWVQDKEAWYYLGADGRMLTGWQQVGGNWYYLDTDGHMLTGQQVIGGKSYSFRQDGSWIEA